jgi:hypothetical protein
MLDTGFKEPQNTIRSYRDLGNQLLGGAIDGYTRVEPIEIRGDAGELGAAFIIRGPEYNEIANFIANFVNNLFNDMTAAAQALKAPTE